jgi:protein SDA1
MAEEATTVKKFGEIDTKDFIPGAETVKDDLDDLKPSKKRKRRADSDSESDGDWEAIDQYSDDDGEEAGGEPETATSLEERKANAMEVTTSRILSDADFKKIEAAQLRKQVQVLKKSADSKTGLPFIISQKCICISHQCNPNYCDSADSKF